MTHKNFFHRGRAPFIVAEMSGNHNHSLARALEIVEAAKKAGADAVKLQTYTADTLTLDIDEGEFFISDADNLWRGQSLYQLYRQAYTPWEWHRPIFERCRELGLCAFSTPFDFTAVDFLEGLNVPFYKIASFENIDLPLIRKIARTGKPIIASTGMAGVAELAEMAQAARENGCPELVLLKCTSNYPATPKGSNLLTIPHMRELFRCETGISDHTMGIGAAVAAVALGAVIIEKHFTLSRDDGGVDAAFSMEPAELGQLARESKNAWQALGQVSYEASEQEKKSLLSRRSLYITEDVKKGEPITEKNMRSVRPGLGLPPKYYDIIIGRKAARDLKRGTPVSWDVF
ncbi:MAG: pseudaminic acid synthase [Acidaminococcales bacterium]|jgi:N-acetylneuraminate synthase|nr:pseudaminic acid synthase [Acidaminococcales bacterium]